MLNPVVLEDMAYITGLDIPWEKLRNKTVLISGAAGFLPTYLVETLLYLNASQELNIHILAIVRTMSKARKRFEHHLDNKALEIIEQDICQPFDIDQPVHLIIHAASFADPKIFQADPVGTILPNTAGTHNLLTLASKHNAEEFLYFSTTGVYGFLEPEKYPVQESCFGSLDPTHVSSCYLESKRMGENLCVSWMEQHGLSIKIVRPAITYGPGLDIDGGRSYEDFVNCIVKHKNITLYSDGRAIRNFCYIADATAGFFRVLLQGKSGEAYNIATDHEISIKDLAEQLVAQVFADRKLHVDMRVDASHDFLRTQFSRTTVDITKARHLGWTLNFPIHDGFKRTVASIETT